MPRVALDSDVLRRLVSALRWQGGQEPDAESVAVLRIYFYVANPLVTPTIADELAQKDEPGSVSWKSFNFQEIARPDDFFRGCVKGMAERYLDYHPDPRDCRVVAEAECAKADAFLSLNAELVRGLGGRIEAIHVLSPAKYWKRAHLPRGAAPRLAPAHDTPLAVAGWWRW